MGNFRGNRALFAFEWFTTTYQCYFAMATAHRRKIDTKNGLQNFLTHCKPFYITKRTKKMNSTLKIQAKYTQFLPKSQQFTFSHLTTPNCSPYAILAFAKSKASREKLNKSIKANTSTPLNRAFFVRNFRTPQKSGFCRLFSMVGRNRHAYAWLLSFIEQFSHPVTPYRPNCEKFSGSSSKFNKGLSKMLFRFFTGRKPTYTIQAEVRQKLGLSQNAVCVARYPSAYLAQKQANTTACKGVRYA